jgi:hypothetical protein
MTMTFEAHAHRTRKEDVCRTGRPRPDAHPLCPSGTSLAVTGAPPIVLETKVAAVIMTHVDHLDADGQHRVTRYGLPVRVDTPTSARPVDTAEPAPDLTRPDKT